MNNLFNFELSSPKYGVHYSEKHYMKRIIKN